MRLNVLMEKYYKLLHYQVGESQTCCERCLLDNVRICIFCNASHLTNKILYIAEENSSGAEYKYNNIQDLTNKVKFYLENYYSKEFKNNDKNM